MYVSPTPICDAMFTAYGLIGDTPEAYAVRALEIRATVTWTKDLPTAPGHYWYRGECDAGAVDAVAIRVIESNWPGGLVAWQPYMAYKDPLTAVHFPGEWAGPILPPAAVPQEQPGAARLGYILMHEDAVSGIGKWLAAALDDPSVCAEMKQDIVNWLTNTGGTAPT
jgi:hypothetical protein